MDGINGYDLSRAWFNWCFENPEKISPNHTALYFFIIEHCNRLGWKKKFGLPTTMAMEAIGIRSYNTYIKTFRELVDFGFIILIEGSKNQYSSNIVALSNFDKAPNKALDKALIKHSTKQVGSTIQSTGESISSIDKQRTKNKKQETKNKEHNVKSTAEQSTMNLNYEDIINFFNSKTKGVFGEVRYPISEKRMGNIRARIREHGKAAFAETIEKATASDFLKGQNDRGFKATFDWLMKPSNFQKTLEGNYENRQNRQKGHKASVGTSDEELADSIRRGIARGLKENAMQ